jgi:hypothetical protein
VCVTIGAIVIANEMEASGTNLENQRTGEKKKQK